ncbi:metal-dependent hydrolase [Sneathiella glossodoripedis]|uniref:metal-dependent hydrolase n=1 Tax=Sneathiella glossodoripedis TaxID=418853 RepID=UPI0004716936|nr:metal-dependent hydrolase [Sneathiella glossodoripedis]
MDSVTQFVLGASVGAAVLGPKYGLRKTALAGGVLGTLPDLDVFWDYGGALENFVRHRSATHSIIVQTLITPLLAEGLRKLLGGSEAARWPFYAAVWLILVTHALLDATTIYGTQLLWPLTDYPFGLGSMFIIDPLYTLPLLVVTLWALIRPKWSSRFGKAVVTALTLSTAYLGWSILAQSWMEQEAKDQFAKRGIMPEQILVIPLPLTTFAWKAIAIESTSYTNLYLPLVSSADEKLFYRHDRWPLELTCDALQNYPAHDILQSFTKGFYSLSHLPGGSLMQADLRMGMTPDYVFRFELQAQAREKFSSGHLARRVASTRTQEGDFEWLANMTRGHITIRPAEAANLLPAKPKIQQQAKLSCKYTGDHSSAEVN